MPKTEVFSNAKNLSISVGGSALVRQPTFWELIADAFKLLRGQEIRLINYNLALVGGLIELNRQLTAEGRSVVEVVGGGALARMMIKGMQEDAKKLQEMLHLPEEISDEEITWQYDQLGIGITRANASTFLGHNQLAGLNAEWFSSDKSKPIVPGFLYIRGGDKPGHTTDMVAVELAKDIGAPGVINIGETPGLYQPTETGYDPTKVVERMTYDEYFSFFDPHTHTPGGHSPFEPAAAWAAKDNDMVVAMVGPDLENIRRLITGTKFKGTLLTCEVCE